MIAIPLLSLLLPTAAAAAWPDVTTPLSVGGGHEGDTALVVGIEDYTHLTDIPGAADTARDWAGWFSSSLGLAPDAIELLTDQQATFANLTEGLVEAALGVQEGGTLWMVYVGHCAYPPQGMDRSLLPVDVEPNASSVQQAGLAFNEVQNLLVMGTHEQAVLLLDTNLSGVDGDGTPLIPDLSRVVPGFNPTLDGRTSLLVATRGREPTVGLAGPGRSAFGYLALGGLRGWADADGDGRVTSGEVLRYSGDAVALLTGRQITPRVFGSSELVLSRGAEPGPDLPLLAWTDGQARLQARRARLDKEEARVRDAAARTWEQRPLPGESSTDSVRTFLATFLTTYFPLRLQEGQMSRWVLVPEAEEALRLIRQLAPQATPAGPTVASQRAVQLTEEIRTRAERNAWKGVDAAFRELETLLSDGVSLTLEQCVWGAQAARSLGQVDQVRQRLLLALRASDGQWAQRLEVVAWLNEVEASYGAAECKAASREESTFTPAQMPFPPDQRAAVQYAQATLASDGRFSGWLPAGLYELGQTRVLVVPGEPPRSFAAPRR